MDAGPVPWLKAMPGAAQIPQPSTAGEKQPRHRHGRNQLQLMAGFHRANIPSGLFAQTHTWSS